MAKVRVEMGLNPETGLCVLRLLFPDGREIHTLHANEEAARKHVRDLYAEAEKSPGFQLNAQTKAGELWIAGTPLTAAREATRPQDWADQVREHNDELLRQMQQGKGRN